VVEKNGGKVLGSVRVPFNSADFSSYLLQAQTSAPRWSRLRPWAATPPRAEAGARVRLTKMGRKSPRCS